MDLQVIDQETPATQEPQLGVRPSRSWHEVYAGFVANGARTPQLKWSPDPADLMHAHLVQFWKGCRALASPTGRVCATDFDILDFAHVQEWLMVVDILPDDGGLQYIHFGDGIAQQRGLSLQGRDARQLHPHIAAFVEKTFQEVRRRKTWLFSVHEPPAYIFANEWRRLVVPLFDETGDNVVRFAVVSVPTNAYTAGFEAIPDPVLVVDPDYVVRFANRAACEMFGRTRSSALPLELFDFAGIDLDLPMGPETLADNGLVRDMRSLAICGHFVERFFLTVSGIRQGTGAFYLITLRPCLSDFGQTIGLPRH